MNSVYVKLLSEENPVKFGDDLSEAAVRNIILIQIHNRLTDISDFLYNNYKAPTMDMSVDDSGNTLYTIVNR